ncbi:MAG: phosphoribosylglycinamide formyltransferase [Myxococcales bacterium]|nr:phosphoribosylglycinamide formyltransferase [Myxococcales bacterium]
MRLGLLVSGSGSNLQAILDAAREGRLGGALPTVVISNVPGVRALERARDAGVEALEIDHRAFASRPAFDAALQDALRARAVDLVVLAGFMRLLTGDFLAAFPGRVINIHPSLLPAFPGLHAPRQALDYGARIAGCTVHFVDEGTDTGAIIAQASVEVRDDDDEEALAARILAEEHRLYPQVIRQLAERRIERAGRRVRIGVRRA